MSGLKDVKTFQRELIGERTALMMKYIRIGRAYGLAFDQVRSVFQDVNVAEILCDVHPEIQAKANKAMADFTSEVTAASDHMKAFDAAQRGGA